MKKRIRCKRLVHNVGWNGSAVWEVPSRSVRHLALAHRLVLMNIMWCDAVSVPQTSQTPWPLQAEPYSAAELLYALNYAAILENSLRELRSRSLRRTAGRVSRRTRNVEKAAMCNPQYTLKKEAELSSEESVYNYQTAHCHSQEERNINSRESFIF